MNLKCVILSERSQTQETTCYMIPFIGCPGKGKTRDRQQIEGMPH